MRFWWYFDHSNRKCPRIPFQKSGHLTPSSTSQRRFDFNQVVQPLQNTEINQIVIICNKNEQKCILKVAAVSHLVGI